MNDNLSLVLESEIDELEFELDSLGKDYIMQTVIVTAEFGLQN